MSYTMSIAATGHSWDDGVVTVEATADASGTKTYTCTSCGLTKTESYELTDEDLYALWRAEWIAENIDDSMSDYEKVVAILNLIHYDFSYGSGSTALKLWQNGYGTCLAGAQMLVDLCSDLGIEAEVRFAGNDYSTYHINYGQTSTHYNAFVWIDGVQYIGEATPGRSGGLIEWTPDEWIRSYQYTSGEISLTEGGYAEELTFAGTSNATFFIVYLKLGLMKTELTLDLSEKAEAFDTTVDNIMNVFDRSVGDFKIFAYNNEIVSVTSSNEDVLSTEKWDRWNETEDGFAYLEIVGTGTTTLTIVTYGNTEGTADYGITRTWTYTITITE